MNKGKVALCWPTDGLTRTVIENPTAPQLKTRIATSYESGCYTQSSLVFFECSTAGFRLNNPDAPRLQGVHQTGSTPHPPVRGQVRLTDRWVRLSLRSSLPTGYPHWPSRAGKRPAQFPFHRKQRGSFPLPSLSPLAVRMMSTSSTNSSGKPARSTSWIAAISTLPAGIGCMSAGLSSSAGPRKLPLRWPLLPARG